jgi:alpha-2-macroglobulin
MAAMYLGGDRRYEAELKKPDTSDLTNARRNDWTFWSDLRSRGFQLAIYHDLFGSQGAEGEKLAALVGNGLAMHRSSWYTTQEMSWGLTGLGKWVGSDATDVGKATLTVDGQAARAETVQRKGGSEVVWTLTGASAARALSLDVGRTSRPLYAVISVQGVKADAPPSESAGLWLSRELLGADGSALGADHDLGQAMYVRLSVRNTSGHRQQNVAVVDRLPAGFEIENPRLGRGQMPDWLDEDTLWGLEHMNLRDDRVEVFGTLERGETRFVVYQVRAVTGGTFTHPPVTGEAMYDPSLRARTAPTKVVIRDPWTGS